jgi:hypothetical protein
MDINLHDEISNDETERLHRRARRKFEMDLASQLIAVREQSWSEGKLAGLLEAKLEAELDGRLKARETIAKKMICLGLDYDIIEKSTGYSTDELNAMRSKPS